MFKFFETAFDGAKTEMEPVEAIGAKIAIGLFTTAFAAVGWVLNQSISIKEVDNTTESSEEA